MKRRRFLQWLGVGGALFAASKTPAETPDRQAVMREAPDPTAPEDRAITLFLSGDVMTGRGIDQVLPHPVDPRICEPYARSALDYVRLAEEASGEIPMPVGFPYVWGDAFAAWERIRPHARIVNLETAVTTSEDCWPGKGINYRMHPRNIPVLTAAAIDCCILANNHVLDWGYGGLLETLAVLRGAGILACGAGRDRHQAEAPAVLTLPGKGRVIVLSLGLESSGIPASWSARPDRPGVNLLPHLSSEAAEALGERLAGIRRRGDILVASIHWGGNWGYAIPARHVAFAHDLIDRAGVDVIHGHSSHHPLGIEIYRGRPILYGCGDLLNDYEGISGYDEYRAELALMYFPTLDPETGGLRRFELVPVRVQRFRLNRASTDEIAWLQDTLDREGRQFGTRVRRGSDDSLRLDWDRG